MVQVRGKGDEYKAVNKIRFNKHPKRQNNDIVAAMYAMYQTGKSLAKIAIEYRRTRQAVYDVFKTRGYELRKKKIYPEIIVDGIKFTPSHKKGYWRATSREKNIFLHSYVWRKNGGVIPEKYGVHHKDGDFSNNVISNLECLPIVEISRRFSNPMGKNQYTNK